MPGHAPIFTCAMRDGENITTNIIFLFQSFSFFQVCTICFLIEICALSFPKFFERLLKPLSLLCKNDLKICPLEEISLLGKFSSSEISISSAASTCESK